MTSNNKQARFGLIILLMLLPALFYFWWQTNDYKPQWRNIPAPPTLALAPAVGLGDKQLAYRFYVMVMQNFGNVAGRFENLNRYDYGRLKEWFLMLNELDPRSDSLPYLAAYYFGSTTNKDNIRQLIDYLIVAGNEPYEEKWRWEAQAVFLARYVLEDSDLALELAYDLADNESEDISDWARQMPAFIMSNMGDKEGAFTFMVSMLQEEIDTLHPIEVNFMIDYICNNLLPETQGIETPEFCLSAADRL